MRETANNDEDDLRYQFALNAAEDALQEIENGGELLPTITIERAYAYLEGLLRFPSGQTVGRALLNTLAPHLEQRGYRENWVVFLTGLIAKSNDPLMQADCAFHLGTVYIRMSLYDEAAEYFRKVCCLAPPDSLRYVQATLRVAISERTLSTSARLALLQTALEQVQTDLAERGYVYDAMSAVHLELGNTAEAKACMEEALRDWRDCDSRRLEAWGLSNYASLLWKMGDYAKAFEHGWAAVRIFEALDDRLHLAYTLTSIGICYYRLGNHSDEAMACYNEAIKLSDGLQNHTHVATVTNNKGKLFYNRGEYHQAKELFETAVHLQHPNPWANIYGYINALDNLNETLCALEQPKQALPYLEHAQGLLAQKPADSYPGLRKMIENSLIVTRQLIAGQRRKK